MVPDEMLGLDLDPEERRLWVGFLAAYMTVISRLEKDLEGSGVSLVEHMAMIRIGAAGEDGLRMSEVGDVVFLTRSAATRLVDRLERAGFVQRKECEADRRGTVVCLTEAGREQVRALAPAHLAGVRREFLDRLPRDGREALERACAELRAGGPYEGIVGPA